MLPRPDAGPRAIDESTKGIRQPQELCESRGGRAGPPLISLMVSVDVKQQWTMMFIVVFAPTSAARTRRFTQNRWDFVRATLFLHKYIIYVDRHMYIYIYRILPSVRYAHADSASSASRTLTLSDRREFVTRVSEQVQPTCNDIYIFFFKTNTSFSLTSGDVIFFSHLKNVGESCKVQWVENSAVQQLAIIMLSYVASLAVLIHENKSSF